MSGVKAFVNWIDDSTEGHMDTVSWTWVMLYYTSI